MIYVFHVDTGTMTTYNMKMALESVSYLKQVVESKTRIPVESQVLLVSGGEVLKDDARVCSYSAGTDTNPIYMFSKILPGERPAIDFGPVVEKDLRPAVEASCALAATLGTVTARAQLAAQFGNMASDVARQCQQLVHDQHLQQQGWSAVVANLEDITDEFRARAENFNLRFQEHLKNKDEYEKYLERFNEDLEMLSKIPILPALRLNAVSHPFTAFDELQNSDSYTEDITATQTLPRQDGDSFTQEISERDRVDTTLRDSDEGVTFTAQAKTHDKEAFTLLHWIAAKENQESLKSIAEYCKKGLQMFDSATMENMEEHMRNTLHNASHSELKQIKGLEERLSGLEVLYHDAKKIEKEQHDLAQAFQQRVSEEGDSSVLKTLCASHRVQLVTMLRNQEKLVDICRRCAIAKEELCDNLYQRLDWVVCVESHMSELDSRNLFYHRWLARLRRHLAVVQQLHAAPSLFASAVHEVVRRRTFSQAFLAWASDLASHLLTIHNDEVLRRRDFTAQFQGHFLTGLFPGTEELPPTFASSAPVAFDARLPKLTSADAAQLHASLPQLTQGIPSYDMTSVIKFFKTRVLDWETEGEGSEELGSEHTSLPKETEEQQEFMDVSTLCQPEVVTTATITEDNMETERKESEKFKSYLQKLSNLCTVSIPLLRKEIDRLKSDADEQRSAMREHLTNVMSASLTGHKAHAISLQRLTVDHELELSDVKEELAAKRDEIRTNMELIEQIERDHRNQIEKIKEENQNTEKLLHHAENKFLEMEQRLQDAEAAKQKEIKEIQEKLALENKAELESLRSRFRLVALTNMDRSPSESSLEKIERTDMIEISSHNSILLQTKENMETEKEEAIRAALAEQEVFWREKLTQELDKLKAVCEQEKQLHVSDSVRRIMEEKDRQLEQLRERETALLRECHKYRHTIQQITDPDTDECTDAAQLNMQIQTLENEKRLLSDKVAELQHQLQTPGGKNEDVQKVEPGVAAPYPGHTPLGLAPGTLNLSGCPTNAIVLVLWDATHRHYTVLQESSTMYFVHPDSLAGLQLSIQVADERQRKLYAIAKVDMKEHCNARKRGTRYNVDKGTHFYRVRVKPGRLRHPPPCCPPPLPAGPLHKPYDMCRLGLLLASQHARPLRKWLTFLHAPDMRSRSVMSSSQVSVLQESSRPGAMSASAAPLASRVWLEPSAASASDVPLAPHVWPEPGAAPPPPTAPGPPQVQVEETVTATSQEENLDSIEAIPIEMIVSAVTDQKRESSSEKQTEKREDSTTNEVLPGVQELRQKIPDGKELPIENLRVGSDVLSENVKIGKEGSNETRIAGTESDIEESALDVQVEIVSVSPENVISIPDVCEYQSLGDDVIHENMESEIAEEATP